MTEARWLSPEQTAAYVSRRVDELPRLVRSGKLPSPSHHFGPRSPRWDRVELDSLFTANRTARDLDMDAVEQEAVNAIIERARREKAARGRNSQRVPLRPRHAQDVESRAGERGRHD